MRGANVIAVLALAAASCCPPPIVHGASKSSVSLVAWSDLPADDAERHDLSALVWDDQRHALLAIGDKTPRMVLLTPDATYATWRVTPFLDLQASFPWDGEGLVVTASGYLICDEHGPTVHSFDRSGAETGTLPIPAHYQRSLPNLSFEGLALTPDGRFLYMGMEAALSGDAPEVIRILRHDLETGAEVEFAYPLDTMPNGRDLLGVSELVALDRTTLLVLERGYLPEAGNQVRIYRVDLEQAVDVIAKDHLDDESLTVKKRLFVDLAALSDTGFPVALQTEPTLLLENYEGMSLGPRLDDGRRLLFLVSDDNSRATQRARILVLAIPAR